MIRASDVAVATTGRPAAATSNRIMWLVWLLAGLGLVLSLVRGPLLKPRPLEPLAHEAEWFTGGFRPGGTYTSTDDSALPTRLRHIGSWVDGDAWQGTATTRWVPVQARPIAVFVAGYPRHRGCSLTAEFRTGTQAIVRIAFLHDNPREGWNEWRFTPPAGATALRIVAKDHASDNAGWLAFSEPVVAPSDRFAAAFMGAQVFTTVALSLVLVFGPGLLLQRLKLSGEARLALLLGAGPLVLVIGALVIWAGGGVVRSHYLGFAFTTGCWAALGWALYRFPPRITRSAGTVLAIAALIVIATAAKATYAGGPENELYGGTISRTLEVGDRSDARISFHVVQTVGRHMAPWNPTAEGYFSPWTFFSRGPLAGLTAVPVSLATSGRPPVAMPDQVWTPFDTTGFAAYRIVLMTLASGVLLALFAVLVPFVGERWAVIGAGLLALCPFVVHDVMFTWPKWEATAWVLVAFLFAHRGRGLVAGIMLAVGFLYHPLAGLWAPWIALWAARGWRTRPAAALTQAVAVAVGVGILAGGWMLAGKLAPHLATSTDAGQLGFLGYFRQADNAPAHWASWWQSRWMNFANTFLPGWLIGHYAYRLDSVYGPITGVTKFSYSWWNTLPFGMGLVLWAVSLVACLRAARRMTGSVLVLLVGPALLLIAYWGATALGLMRECGHPLFVAIAGVTVVVLARHGGRLARFVAHPVFPWLQLPGVLAMLWLTTLLNPHPPTLRFAGLDPAYLAINGAALVAAAWVLSRYRKAALAEPAAKPVTNTSATPPEPTFG